MRRRNALVSLIAISCRRRLRYTLQLLLLSHWRRRRLVLLLRLSHQRRRMYTFLLRRLLLLLRRKDGGGLMYRVNADTWINRGHQRSLQ